MRWSRHKVRNKINEERCKIIVQRVVNHVEHYRQNSYSHMCPTPRLKLNFFGRSLPYKWMFHRFSDLKVTDALRINIINRCQDMECYKKCDAVFNTASCRQHEQVGKLCKKPATHLHKCYNERNRSAIKLLRVSV